MTKIAQAMHRLFMPALLTKSFRNPKKALDRAAENLIHGHRKIFLYAAIYLVYWWKRLSVRTVIVVSPGRPPRKSVLWKVAMLSGVRMVPDAGGLLGLARFRHANNTWDMGGDDGCINGRCTDISKSRVDAIFNEIFGYSTRIDPTAHQGRAVKKSEQNFSGGGIFIKCPVAPRDVDNRFIYQRLIENTIAPGVVREYRVSVIGQKITDVIVQRRGAERRLQGRGSGASLGSEFCSAEEVFSPEEIARILAFCERLGLDFGELDILPDVPEGRIYILDANKTPSYMSKPSAFRFERLRLLYRRTVAFKRLLHEGAPAARAAAGGARIARAGPGGGGEDGAGERSV